MASNDSSRMKRAAMAMAAGAAAVALASCSVGSLVSEELARHDAVVIMADSTRLRGKALLPDCRAHRFTLTTTDGSRLRLSPDSVGMMVFGGQGGGGATFICAPYKDRGGSLQPASWMVCLGSGPHLRIAMLAASWHYDRDGRLTSVSFADGDAYIIGLKDGAEGRYLTTCGRPGAVVGRALRGFLSDDPQLCRDIEEGEVGALDFAEICRRYTPRANHGYDVRMALRSNRQQTAGKGGPS